MSALAEPQLNVDQHFTEIMEGVFSTEEAVETLPEDGRIRVMVDMSHLQRYGRETTVELVYGCSFPVKVGDAVLCPPAPRGDGNWMTGVVVALDGNGYKGPVKYVRKIEGAS